MRVFVSDFTKKEFWPKQGKFASGTVSAYMGSWRAIGCAQVVLDVITTGYSMFTHRESGWDLVV